MKSLCALVICLASCFLPGCAAHIGSTYHRSGTYLGASGSYTMSGISGQMVVQNLGPGEIQVTVRDQSGLIISEQTLGGKRDCMVTIGESDELKVVNNSKKQAEIRVRPLN